MTLPTYDEAMATSSDRSPFSNGTEGECWMDRNCATCIHDKPARTGDPANGCPLILVAYEGRLPAMWVPDKPGYLGEQWRCMYFRDEDDGGDPEPKPIPDPPGQITLLPREPYEGVRMLTGNPARTEVTVGRS